MSKGDVALYLKLKRLPITSSELFVIWCFNDRAMSTPSWFERGFLLQILGGK